MTNPIQFVKKYIDLNRAIYLILIAITAFATFQTAMISRRLANQNLQRLQAELRPYLTINLYPEPNIFGTQEYLKRDGNSNYFWDELYKEKYLILPFKIKNVGKLPAINIKAKYESPTQPSWFKIGENSISPDSETGEFFHPHINISSLINDEKVNRFEINVKITYNGNDEVDPRTYFSELRMEILKENKTKYLIEGTDFKFGVVQ